MYARKLNVGSPINFVEIFLNRRLFSQLLTNESITDFLTHAEKYLQNIPMSHWPYKAFYLIEFFKTLTPESQLWVATTFTKSTDRKTAEMGEHFLSALQSKSIALNEQIPHFRALGSLLEPYMNEFTY